MTGLDTNIPSELTRPRPEPRVFGWLDNAIDSELYFSVVSLGEILKGVTILPSGKRRNNLQQWLDETLRPWFQGRIIPINEAVAERWGVLSGECQLKGRTLKVADGLIARRRRSNTAISPVATMAAATVPKSSVARPAEDSASRAAIPVSS